MGMPRTDSFRPVLNLVPRERLELPTCGLGNRCSVLLSYRGIAPVLFVPNTGVNRHADLRRCRKLLGGHHVRS